MALANLAPLRGGLLKGSLLKGLFVGGGLGPELITNGGFDADTDWTKADAAWTIDDVVADKAHCDGSQGGNANLRQTLNAPAGNYRIEFTVSNYSAGTVRGTFTVAGGTARVDNGTYSEVLAVTDGTSVVIRGNADFNGSVDDVSVRKIL